MDIPSNDAEFKQKAQHSATTKRYRSTDKQSRAFPEPIRTVENYKKNQQENIEEENDDSEDLVPLNQLEPPKTFKRSHITADMPTIVTTPPNTTKYYLEESIKTTKKQKLDDQELRANIFSKKKLIANTLKFDEILVESPSTSKSNRDEFEEPLTEGHTPVLAASEKFILKEIRKLSWEIRDMKKTLNTVHELLISNNLINNIENIAEKNWQLPIENQTQLESLEQHLESDEKSIELLSQQLYLSGGDTIHKAIFLMLKKLMAKEIAVLYSGTGKKGKLSFQKLGCYKSCS